MKTPRDLLFERNSDALTDLDRIRCEVVSGLDEARSDVVQAPSFWSWLATPWRELVAPSHYAWAAIAGAWLVILAANFLMSSQPRDRVADAKRNRDDVSVPCVMTMIQERRSQVAEFTDNATEQGAHPRAPVIAPHRESRREQSGAPWLTRDARSIA